MNNIVRKMLDKLDIIKLMIYSTVVICIGMIVGLIFAISIDQKYARKDEQACIAVGGEPFYLRGNIICGLKYDRQR